MAMMECRCTECGTDLRGEERCYRVMEMCADCAILPNNREEAEERWQSYMDEKYDTVEANQ